MVNSTLSVTFSGLAHPWVRMVAVATFATLLHPRVRPPSLTGSADHARTGTRCGRDARDRVDLNLPPPTTPR